MAVSIIIIFILLFSFGILAWFYTENQKKQLKLLKEKDQINENAQMKIESLQSQLSESRLIIKDAKNKSDEAEKLRSTFVANLSHEIRIPLNSVVGFVSLLSKRNISEGQKHLYIENIAHSSNDLLHIIDDILDLSQIETGNMRMMRSNFDLNEMMASVYRHFFETKNRRGKDKIELINHCVDQEYIIFCDEVRLKQVFNHLITNSLKFTDKGQVEFGFEKNENSIVFYVKDSGIGISQDHQDIISKRFQKQIGENNKSFSGIGFGLALAGDLTKLLGGEIWLKSEQSIGSTFYFSLPLSSITQQ